ncbi:dimethyladenosine transferase 2, mitochondrial-like [Penaeus chinensis]|uniref:dimethyladenosine transferase 2, mitochondrial-like n=1 Tax=Penaeus chinensis TaxID=139456 RepID=UPI001FB80135|nr:dimethyladenosine transferase 2, mitochondrial-like [Penaeus chinensis]
MYGLSRTRTIQRCWANHTFLSSFLVSKETLVTYGSRSSLTTDDKEEPTLAEESLTFTKRRQMKKKVQGVNKTQTVSISLNSDSEKVKKNHSIKLMKGKNTEEVELLVKAYDKWLKKDNKKQMYLLDQKSADRLVHHLLKDIKSDDVIAESHPGPGILTRTLLKETANDIITFEPQPTFASHLKESLLPQHSSRLTISHLDLQKFYTYYVHGKKVPEKDRLHELLKLFPTNTKKFNSNVKMVGVVCDPKFFFRLTLSFAFQCCFFENIFPTLYLYIPFRLYSRISLSLGHFAYSKVGVPFQFYFNLDHLESVPQTGFYPPYPLAASRKRLPEDDFLHLVKISANEEFFNKVPREELESFHYFLNRICLTKRKDTLITQLEKWIPACGPEFIKNGFRVFTHPRELTQDQLLQAYYIFSKLPAYEGSMFHHYRRHWAIQFGERDEEVVRLKSDDEVVELEDQVLEN